jgi:DNA-binding response OmpR family regulator
VDDDPVNVDILMEALDNCGYILDSAGDGQEAWDKIQAAPNRYSAVLLDRMMPIMDGMELLRLIKSDPAFKNMPIIMQTAAAMSNQIVEGLDAGAYYYLIKPFDSQVLLSILRTAIREYEQHDELRRESATAADSAYLLQSAHYHLRTLDEARLLALSVASLFPEPYRVVTGLAELLINAVEHGLLGIGYQGKTELNNSQTWEEEILRRLDLPENKNKHIEVNIGRTATQMVIEINDFGKGFSWQEYIKLSPKRAFDNHGRGIAMAKLLSFDELSYNAIGNEVTACVNLKLTHP